MTISQPPVTKYETLHDYRLLEEFKKSGQASHAPAAMAPPLPPQSRAAFFLAAVALAVAVVTLIYAYHSSPPALVPGTFHNALATVNARGQIVSITQGSLPATIMVTPTGQQPVSPGLAQADPQRAPPADAPKKPFPWSMPSPPSVESTTPPNETPAPTKPESEPAKIVENFVKFSTVSFKTGIVDTAWRYADSNATEPEAQWCYYRNLASTSKGLDPTLDLKGEADLEAIRTIGLTYDEYLEARKKCQWFNGVEPVAKQPGKTY